MGSINQDSSRLHLTRLLPTVQAWKPARNSEEEEVKMASTTLDFIKQDSSRPHLTQLLSTFQAWKLVRNLEEEEVREDSDHLDSTRLLHSKHQLIQ